jgi:hypothetical protein
MALTLSPQLNEQDHARICLRGPDYKLLQAIALLSRGGIRGDGTAILLHQLSQQTLAPDEGAALLGRRRFEPLRDLRYVAVLCSTSAYIASVTSPVCVFC